MRISADDKLIWNLGTERLLTATKDLVMEDNKERAFTAGKTYRVKSMHPIAEPAYVILVDDQGEDHKMTGEHIREFFGAVKKPQNVIYPPHLPDNIARPVAQPSKGWLDEATIRNAMRSGFTLAIQAIEDAGGDNEQYHADAIRAALREHLEKR